MPVRLGDLLVQKGLISTQQLQEVVSHQKQYGGTLRDTLLELGFIKDEEITRLLSRHYGVPSIDLNRVAVDPSVIKLLPAETAQKYQVFPISREGSSLRIAMADPSNVFAMDDIKFMTGFNVEPVLASEKAVMDAIERYYGDMHSQQIKEELDKLVDDSEDIEDIDLDALERSSEESPVVKLCNLIFADALRRGASEIHIESYQADFRVRFRIDGILSVVMNPPMMLRDAIINQFKLMSRLDISKKGKPQCGRIRLRMNTAGQVREFDYLQPYRTRTLNKDRILKAADGYIRSGKVEKALGEYKKWLAENPEDWNTIRQVADLYARIDKNVPAIQNYTKIAEHYSAEGFADRAVAIYKTILRLEPHHEPTNAALAELFVEQGLLAEAKSQYQSLVKLYFNSGHKRRAITLFKKLAEIDPSDLALRYELFEFLGRHEYKEEAIAECINISEEFITNDLAPEAIQMLEKGLQIDGTNLDLRCKLAQALNLQEDYQRAIELLEEIRDQHTEDTVLLTLLEEAYRKSGKLEESEAISKKLEDASHIDKEPEQQEPG